MKHILIVVALVACGPKPPPPPSNTAAPTTPEAPPKAPPTSETSRVVQRSSNGGVIELAGDRRLAMQFANEEMRLHCGAGKYVITQEGEESVGRGDGGPRTMTAWRIHYQCNSQP
jgi:hypothetical protein